MSQTTAAAKPTIIEIKQVPDISASVIGLQKYGRSKLPNTFDIVYCGRGTDGRFLTGIDEESAQINSLPPAEQFEIKARVKKEREWFQSVLGVADLSATSPWWLTFKVNLTKTPTLNLSVPKEKLMYKMLIACGFLAQNLEATNSPDHHRTKFYAHKDQEEVSKAVQTGLVQDRAASNLYAMRENKTMLVLIGKALFGTKIREDSDVDYIYNEIKSWMKAEKKQENSKKFDELSRETPESLSIRLTVKEAIEKQVITYRDKLYQRGNITLGKKIEDVIVRLGEAQMSAELASIMEELEEKNK